MKVYWTRKAKTRLRELYEYIALNSPTRAIQVVDRITKRSMLLAHAPRADRHVPEYSRDDLREVLERPYRIIYAISEQRIDILTIKHYQQRLADRPSDL